LAVSAAAGCSNPDPVQPRSATDETETPAPAASPDDETSSSDTAAEVDTTSTSTATSGTSAPSASTLADQDVVADVIDLDAGAQVQDLQGNLIAVHGFVQWPTAFADLSDETQTSYPFFGDADAAADPTTELGVLDVSMCSAGIDAAGFGTAEFFVHADKTDVLSQDRVRDRGLLTRHPVVAPGFFFPSSATCTRGWLPVIWSGDQAPSTARYVLTTRKSAADDAERHVYQWDISDAERNSVDEPRGGGSSAAELDADDATVFRAGQTVTFVAGSLADTTVQVSGWSELVGTESELEGTRVVGIALTVCASAAKIPEFGLSVDGWNIARTETEIVVGDDGCFDDWVWFVVPFGGVPTGFFASDGANPMTGYAAWSLDGAALPAPQ